MTINIFSSQSKSKVELIMSKGINSCLSLKRLKCSSKPMWAQALYHRSLWMI